MTRTREAIDAVTVSIVVLVLFEATALYFTYIANKYNIQGLAWIVLAIWILVGASALFLMRKRLSRLSLILLTPLWFVGGVVAYTMIGYTILGWVK